MKTRTLCFVTVAVMLTAAAVFTLSGCGQQDVFDADQIEQQLHEPNGGFDTVDESPYFGLEPRFAEAQLLEADRAVPDELIEQPDVAELIHTPGARRYVITAVWGQPSLDWSVSQVTNWSGSVSVNRGVVWAMRTVRFDREDALLPRNDPRVVPFRSLTLPHHDGLTLQVVDPDIIQPAIAGEVTLQFANMNQPITIGFHELPGLRRVIPVDNLGNVIILVAEALPLDNNCAVGFLRGAWHRLTPQVGFFLGQWMAHDGTPRGVLRGIYGQLPNGDRVFFGKYISLLGQFRGLLVGTYEDGRFGGLWLDHTGVRGILGGAYREVIPGPETGGFFLGGWRQTACEPDPSIDPDPDPNQP